MSQISVLKRITTKDQQNCEKFNQIILKKDLNQIFIGRDIDCNYRISSIEISRRHALLEYSLSDNYWTVSDLNPNSPYRLVDGDRVSFGPPNQSQFCYQFVDNYSQNSSNCVSYELSAINLTTIPVIPIVTRIQNSSTNSSLLSSSLHFDIESNQSRTISLTTTMPTRSGLIYSGSNSRLPRVSTTSSVTKKTASRKTSVDQRDTQSITSFEEHDYSRNSSSNRNSSDKNNKKRMSSLKLKDNNCDSKSKALKCSEIERKLIAKEKEKLEKSKKSLEHQRTVELSKIKRKEEELKKKQKEFDRKVKEAKKREEEIEKMRKDFLKEKKRFDDNRQELNKESEQSVRQSAKRKLRSSSGRESIDSKRQCSEDNKQKIIEELFESELTCSVCSEYFIQAVNLNCSHTFCLSCIEEWKKQKTGSHVCPICREPIENYNRELILDNLIDQFVTEMKPNLKEHRKKLSEERKKLLEKKSTHNSNNNRNASTPIRGNGLSRLIPSLHFFLRSNTITDSDSDTDDVDVIGLDFGDNFLSSSSSVSSASSDSDSDDSSDDSNSSDDESVANSSRRSSSSDSETESTGPYVSLTSPNNNSNDSNFSYSSDSDVESVVSLHSNDSNRIQIDNNLFDGSDDSDDSDFSIND